MPVPMERHNVDPDADEHQPSIKASDHQPDVEPDVDERQALNANE